MLAEEQTVRSVLNGRSLAITIPCNIKKVKVIWHATNWRIATADEGKRLKAGW